ncbi:MAG TPA: carbohydrate kinase [Reyranella sp.]|nr:carbohydrate kinase [Reyranella sp.]
MMLSCGDALVDFLPVTAVDRREAFVPAVGGSCLNVAVGMARLGVETGFVGGISTDLFGRMIADHARASQVDLRFATLSDHQTTLAFVRTVGGEPQYAFYDEGTASRHWTYRSGVLPFDRIEAIHVGSTTLVDEQSAAETLALVQEARRSVAISFDPNCRPNLVTDKRRYVERMAAFAEAAHIVRMSDVDFDYLYGAEDPARRAAALLAAGASLVIVTRGAQGAEAWHKAARSVAVAAPAGPVVDTIGAGDSFQAALLFALQVMGRSEAASLAEMTADELRRALSFAARCAAITCSRPGADPPRRAEIAADLARFLADRPS